MNWQPLHIAGIPAAALIIAAGSTLSSVGAAEEQRDESEKVHLSYSLAIFSIPFGHLDYSAAFGRTQYNAEMRFQTSGLLAALWKSEIDNSVHGRTGSQALVPILYISDSENRQGKHQRFQVKYAADGAPVTTADPPYDLGRFPVTEAQKKGTVDPLTAISSIVAGLNTTNRAPCGKTLKIFDGRRRYDVGFTFADEKPASSSVTGVNGRVCKADYRPIAGPKQDVVDVSSVPAIYAEFVDIPDLRGRYTIAERIWSSFLWGAVSARLVDVKIDGQPGFR